MRPFKENPLTERSRWLPNELTVSRKNYFTERFGWYLMAAQPPSFNQLHKPCKALGLLTGIPTFQTSCPSCPFLVLLVHFHVLVLALVFKVWLFLCSGSLLPTAPHRLPKSSWRLVVLENLKAGTGPVVSRSNAINFLIFLIHLIHSCLKVANLEFLFFLILNMIFLQAQGIKVAFSKYLTFYD